ncbi:MAG TPA: potassium channel family protein [Acidimicrobiales bacterium]|nr:potassium channel family protein [Acidimicrobiales bacterium]
MARRLRRDLLALGAVLVFYYAFPVGELPSGAGAALSVLGLFAGLGVLVFLIVRQVRRLVDDRPDEQAVQVDSLILLVFVIVPVFSLGYLGLERADPGQFADLRTKTDALYFTLSTLATVGFGDVHAREQLGRVLVMIQMAFDLVFVAAVVSVLSTHVRERAATMRRQNRDAAATAADAEADAGADDASAADGG